MRQVVMLVLPNGKRPVLEWMQAIRDRVTRARIVRGISKLDRNIGIVRSVGNEIMELKLDFGPGYRVYFAIRGEEVVVLLIGGNKGSQSADIAKAQKFWQGYKDDGMPDEYMAPWN